MQTVREQLLEALLEQRNLRHSEAGHELPYKSCRERYCAAARAAIERAKREPECPCEFGVDCACYQDGLAAQRRPVGA